MKKQAAAFFACFLLSFVHLYSQLRVAINGGAHIATVPANVNPGWDTINYQYGPRTGFHAGLLADLHLSAISKFYLQTGMSYSNKGRTLSSHYDTAVSSIGTVDGKQYVNYMEIPLSLVFKLNIGKKSRIMIGGGPYAGFLYGGRERKSIMYRNGTGSVTENTDLKVAHPQGRYSNFEYGFSGLFGFEFGRLFLTANYSQGLSNFYEANGYPGDFKHQIVGGTIGFYITNAPRKTARLKDHKKERIPEIRLDNTKQPDQSSGNAEVDSDGDGINDREDVCPQLPGLRKYRGCPAPDTDGDGVNDDEDKCPTKFGSKKNNGCPPQDSDGDGISDDEDKCPLVKGVIANHGCPPIKREIIARVQNAARRLQFNYRSTALTSHSKIVLNDVVKILNENPELKVFIEGYTSSDGNPANHMRLSKARAENVKKYLEQKGIDPARLKADGFGAANPLNSGRTEFLRARNRRVELKLTNN